VRQRLPNTPYREHPAVIHGRGCRKRYAVVHDTEGGDVDSVERYFASGRAGGEGDGAHVIADDRKVVQIAPLDALLYHCPGGNAAGIGFELCGYAKLKRYQWIKKRRQRKFVANRIAWLCWANGWGLPRRGKNVFGHGDFPPPNYHTDPGPGFPWDLFMAACRRAYRKLERTHGRSWDK
jgi:N-acetyl-anhydromuramyl-L-alanine amidase AmpD